MPLQYIHMIVQIHSKDASDACHRCQTQGRDGHQKTRQQEFVPCGVHSRIDQITVVTMHGGDKQTIHTVGR